MKNVKNLQKFTKMYKNVRNCTKMYKDVQKCSKMYENLYKLYSLICRIVEIGVQPCNIREWSRAVDVTFNIG